MRTARSALLEVQVNVKGYLQSRTVWGLLVLALTQLVQLAWPSIDATQVDHLATDLASLIGFGLAFWGIQARPDLAGLWQPKKPDQDGAQ